MRQRFFIINKRIISFYFFLEMLGPFKKAEDMI